METNFLMSIAKGQDELAENLLLNTPKSVRLAMPNICYKEFGKPEVTEILRNTGIQYFNKTENLIGWLQSQSI